MTIVSESLGMTAPVAAALTHLGKVRAVNEDRYFIPEEIESQTMSAKGWLYIVADGMGGQQSGDVAAEIAVQTTHNHYYADPDLAIIPSLRRAILAANQRVLDEQAEDPHHAKMGTTLVAAVIRQHELVVAHIGDSRCYHLRGNNLQQITRDHSWVADQVQRGLLNKQDGTYHVFRNALIRGLGHADMSSEPEFASGSIDWRSGDRLLLCSDGLWGAVPQQTMLQILCNAKATVATRQLVSAANSAGGKDNITAIVVGERLTSGLHSLLPSITIAGTTRATKTLTKPLLETKTNQDQGWLLASIITTVFACLCFFVAAGLAGRQLLAGRPPMTGVAAAPPALLDSGEFVPSFNQLKPNEVSQPAALSGLTQAVTPVDAIVSPATKEPAKGTAASAGQPAGTQVRQSPAPQPTVTLAGPAASRAVVVPALSTTIPTAKTATQPLQEVMVCTQLSNGSCSEDVRTLTKRDSNVYITWPIPIPNGSRFEAYWYLNARSVGRDACVFKANVCKPDRYLDVTPKSVRFRVQDLRVGAQAGNFSYEILLNGTIIASGEFTVQ